MSNYAQISLHVFSCKRSSGQLRRYEFRLLEKDSAAASLPFDIEGGVTIEHGSNSHDLISPIKPSQLSFRIKTTSDLAQKIRTAERWQYRLEIRELEQNIDIFEGYLKPDFPQYDLFKAAQTVQVWATGELAGLDAFDASSDLQTLHQIFTAVNTDLDITRPVDYYMRTRYTGQLLSDPIPQRLWMRETGKLGEDAGNRLEAVSQIAQEFNFQVFQHRGRLVVAESFERLKNPQAVNRYLAGTTHGTSDLLIELNEENIISKANDQDRLPTGKRAPRIGRVVQQRRLPEREEGSFTVLPTPASLSSIIELDYNGIVVGGDIIRVEEINGSLDISPQYQVDPQNLQLILRFSMLQFAFESGISGDIMYYSFTTREWVDEAVWGDQEISLVAEFTDEGYQWPQRMWDFPGFDLPQIPEGEKGKVKINIRKDFEVIFPFWGNINTEYVDLRVDNFQIGVIFNDRPDDLFQQFLADNPPGKGNVYPIFESDLDVYSGMAGTMYIGSDPANLIISDSEWIDEDASDLVPFAALSASRKAYLLLGAADRIHVIVPDSTPISLLNVIDFRGARYLPVSIREHLFTGYQELWMKPAPGLPATLSDRYTFDPDDFPSASGRGPGRGWVIDQIIRSMTASLGAGAIARLTHSRSGLVQSLLVDREKVVGEGDEVHVINLFTLERYRFTVIGQVEKRIDVQAKSVPHSLPVGSFVYLISEPLQLAVLASQNAFQIFIESEAIGQVMTDVNGVVDELDVNIFGYLDGGDIIDFLGLGENITKRVSLRNPDETNDQYDPGRQMLKIQTKFLNVPAGTYFKLNGVSLASRFHMDPGELQAAIERISRGNALGVLIEDLSSGAVITSLIVRCVDAIDLLDGQKLLLSNKPGEHQIVTVNGPQTTTASSPWPSGGVNTIISIQSVTLDYDQQEGISTVTEPGYKQTSRLTLIAGKAELNATNITDQSNQIAGLILDTTENGVSIAELFTETSSLQNGIAVEAAARLVLRSDLESATASLTANFNQLDGELSTETSARLALQASVDQAIIDLETDVGGNTIGINIINNGLADGSGITITGSTEFIGDVVVDEAFTFASSDYDPNSDPKKGWKFFSGVDSRLAINRLELWGQEYDEDDIVNPLRINALSFISSWTGSGTSFNVNFSANRALPSGTVFFLTIYRDGVNIHTQGNISSPYTTTVAGGGFNR